MIERIRSYGIVGVFGVLFIGLAIASPSFVSLQNGANILDQSAVLLIFAATTTLCIVAGIFDLSIAAVATASAIMTVNAINAVGLVPGVIVGVAFGGVLGLVTGLAITSTNVNSFIGTLAASFTYRGLGLILAGGGLVSISDKESAATLLQIMDGKFLGLKGAVWIAIGFTVIIGFVLSATVFGKKVYAVGGTGRRRTWRASAPDAFSSPPTWSRGSAPEWRASSMRAATAQARPMPTRTRLRLRRSQPPWSAA